MATAEALLERLRANPGDRSAYEALKRLYRESGELGPLSHLVAEWAGRQGDAREASAGYAEVAGVLEELGDASGAEGFYLESLARSPRNVQAREALLALWERHEDFARITEFLAAHVEALEGHGAPAKEIAPVCVALGRIWARFEEPNEALHHYHRALELDPALGEALDGAIGALERVYRTARTVEVARQLIDLLHRRAAERDERSAAADHARAADVVCGLSADLDPHDAAEALTGALDAAPGHDAALALLERLWEGSEREPELAARWVDYLIAAPDGKRARERRVRLARAYVAQGQVDDAVFALGPAAEAGYAPALELLEELRGGSGAHRAPRPPSERPPRPSTRPSTASPSLPANTFPSSIPPPPRPSTRPSTVPPPPPRASMPASSVPPPPPVPRVASPYAHEHEPGSQLARLKREALEHVRRRDLDAAVATYVRIREIDPLDAEAFDALDGHFRRKQDHAGRVGLLLDSASLDDLPLDTRLARLREAATVYEARLRDADGAVRVWQRFAELDPSSQEPARARKRLLEQAERWDELARSLELEVAEAPSEQAKLGALRRLLAVQRERRRDVEAAVEVLHQIVALAPTDRNARDMLVEDLGTLGRHAEVVPLLERQVGETAGRTQKLTLLRRLAALQRGPLGDDAGAFATLETILTLHPGDPETLAAMEEIDRRSGNHARLLATLERRVGSAGAEQVAELHLEMAAIARQSLGDTERAAELLSRALDLAPQDARLLDAFCALYEDDGRYDDLVEMLRERTILEKDRSARTELYRRLARTLRDHFEDFQGEVEAWQKVLDLGDDAEALAALRVHADRAGNPALAVDVLGRLARLERDPGERRAILFDRASLLLGPLERPADALADLVRLLKEIDPGFGPAIDALTQACDRTGDHRPLAEALERQLDVAREPAERARLAETLADLYEAKVPDADRALRALGRWAEAAGNEPEPHRRMVRQLEPRRRWAPLLASLDALARLEPEIPARAQAVLRAADVAATRLRDADGAWNRLAELVEIDAAAAEEPLVALAHKTNRLDALYDLLERGGRAQALLRLLRERVERERQPKARAPFWRRIAQVQIELAQNEGGAREAYEALVEIEDDLEALRFLQAIALRDDDPALLEDMLRRLGMLERDPDERRDMRCEQARLLRTRLGRPQDAIAVLERVVAEHPSFGPAIDELLATCREVRDDAKLAAVLERLVAHASEPTLAVEYATQLVDVYERTGDAKRAIRALQRWVELDANDPEPHRKLWPLLEAAGRHQDLLATLDALSTHEPDEAARLAAVVAASRVASDALRDREGAWRRLAPLVLAADPSADEALAALAETAGRDDELFQLLEESERYGTLVARLHERVAREREPKRRIELWRRIAHVEARRLDDEEAAASAWTSLLAIAEDAEALRHLQARALARDEPETLVDCAARLAALEADPREKRDLLFEQGHLLRMRLDRPKDAIVVLRQIVEALDPDFEPALDELTSAAEAAGDDATLALALERLVLRQADEEARIDMLRRLADLYARTPASDAKEAAALERWIALRPNDAAPRRALFANLERRKDAGGMLAQLDALAEVEGDEAHRSEARIAAATLLLDRMRDPKTAWQRARALADESDPRAAEILHRIAFEGGFVDALCDLYAEIGKHDELVRALRTQAERVKSPDERVEPLRRAARVLQEHLGDEVAATALWEELLTVREDVEALEALRVAAERADDPEKLAHVLGRLAPFETDRARLTALSLERARILLEELDRPEEAIVVLRPVLLELEPGHGEAARTLVTAAERAHDDDSLALGLEHAITSAPTFAERAALAKRLSTHAEETLDDPDRARAALLAWSEADPKNLDVHRRLRPYLERAKAGEKLLATLDALAALEPGTAERAEAAIAGAKLADAAGDHEGAWDRLAPHALLGSEPAEVAIGALAERRGFDRALANLYVTRAQRAPAPDRASGDWLRAARILDERLREPAEALEASLRALAIDTADRETLAQVDRLAIATAAWKRLWRVYGRLVDAAPDAATKVELCLRHADILERHADTPAATLDRLIAACKLAPDRTDALDRAEAIAIASHSHAELVWILERRSERAQSDAERIRHLLRFARAADGALGDREQAMASLRRAVELTRGAPELDAEVFEVAVELDRGRPELGNDDARRWLLRTYLELAESRAAPFGSALVMRAAEHLRKSLQDASGAFDALRQGMMLFPADQALYDALERIAIDLARGDALDAHLARAIGRAEDVELRKTLLRRRGRLNAEHLGRHGKASEAFAALVELDPLDVDAARALVSAYERDGRYQEAVRACRRRIERTDDLDERLGLLRRIASLWERELKNRSNAIEAWGEVRALLPDDREAGEALERLAGAG